MACWNHPFEVARIEMQSRADQGQGKVRPSHWALSRTAHPRFTSDAPLRPNACLQSQRHAAYTPSGCLHLCGCLSSVRLIAMMGFSGGTARR